MHLVEQYALSCGVKIDKPHIETSYFPISQEKYITLHASDRIQSKTYDLYNDVIELIKPYLEKNDISVIQIGNKNEKKINGCINHLGQTTIRQAAYIIEKSILHIGTDSFSCHVASGFNKPIVALYSTLYKECCGPYWGDKKNQILLEPDRKKNKASFSDQEYPKSINTIMPEEIACSVLNLLKINHNLDSIETFHIGQAYHIDSIGVIPNHVMPNSFAQGQPANIFAHEHFDEENIIRWAYSRLVNIFTNKPISANYLKSVKQNVNQINYFVQPTDSEDFFNMCKKIGIKLKLVCDNEDQLNDIRLKFFDWDVHFLKSKSKKDIDNYKKICNNTRYKSSQVIMSNSKIYSSKAAWKNDKEGFHDKIIDCQEFWDDAINLKMYNNNGTT